MRETRLKAQADSKNAALKLLEGRVAENEKTRKDHEDRMKFKIETMEQVYYYPSNSLWSYFILFYSLYCYIFNHHIK